MSFVERRLDITFTAAPLKSGEQPQKFAGTNSSTVKLRDLRASARISKAQGIDQTMDLVVYGMTLDMMNQLSTFGVQINLVPQGSVVVEAGDDRSGMGVVFNGNIVFAYADFKGSPEVAFHIVARPGTAYAAIPADPASYTGAADVGTVLSGIATNMGLRFVNNGVTGQLSNPYLDGGLVNQLEQVRQALRFNYTLDSGALVVWPMNGSREGQAALVSPETGMVGYPTFTAYGLMLKTLFNPSIGVGSPIEVRSSIKPANGTYAVYSLDLNLESQTPNGQWFAEIGAYNKKYPQPLPTARGFPQ